MSRHCGAAFGPSLALGCAALLAGPALAGPAQPPARLAATLATPEGSRALVELGAAQAWLRPGQRIGDCELALVESSYAELQCGGHRLRLLLHAGGVDARMPMPQSTRVELPPGAIEALAARPQALALGLDLVPELVHGALRGWRIRQLDAANPLYRLGFREADLVLAVAGFAASEPTALAAGLRTLPQQGAFSVHLLREERPFELLVTAPPAPPRH